MPVTKELNCPSADQNQNKVWKERLKTWGIYAAATGATLAASANADASIIYNGPLTIYQGIASSAAGTAGLITRQRPVTVGAFHPRIHLSNLSERPSIFTNTAPLQRSVRARIDDPKSQAHLSFTAAFHAINSWDANLFALGASIPAVHHSTKWSTNAQLRVNGPGGSHGAFGPGTVSGFIGFRTCGPAAPGSGYCPGSTHEFGWMQVKVFDHNDDGYADQIEVLGYALNTTRGASIAAGDTGVAVEPSSAPEPGSASLAFLACGAAGLLAWRRRRAELARTTPKATV